MKDVSKRQRMALCVNWNKIKEHISYAHVCADDVRYPKVKEEVVNITMTSDVQSKYSRVLEADAEYKDAYSDNPLLFQSGARQASLSLEDSVNDVSQKMQVTLKLVQEAIFRSQKTIVYCNFKTHGVFKVQSLFQQHHISFECITGDVNSHDRIAAVNRFCQTTPNAPQVMLLTAAGSEGLDFRGVERVIVMDPTWNDASMKQVIGRAKRNGSHLHLPSDRRRVKVQYLRLLCSDQSTIGADNVMFEKILQKRNMVYLILQILEFPYQPRNIKTIELLD